MYAVKDNRQYTITKADAEPFRKAGYDIVDDKGKVVAYAVGKVVAYEKYAEALDQIKALKAEVKALKAGK
jgi:hypothetical protein